MQISRTDNTVHVTLTDEEAEAVREDLGQIWASKVSTAGDQLHSLLESVTSNAQDVDDCPGFEGNPVAPDLCAGCHDPRDLHTATA